MGPKSLLFTLQLPCPAGLATVAGNLVGSAMRVWLWFGRACGEAASLQGRACPSNWLWMTLCCAAVQPRDNSCRCKPRASHGSSLTHCTAGTVVASSASGYGRHEPLPMLAARTGDQGTSWHANVESRKQPALNGSCGAVRKRRAMARSWFAAPAVVARLHDSTRKLI